MRKDSLPTPGQLSMGIALHSTMAKAISAVEIAGGYNAGKTSLAKKLDLFLDAAKTAISTYIDAVAPTVASRTVGTVPLTFDGKLTASQVRIRFSKNLDRGYLPAAAAFALAAPAKVISDVRIDGPDVILTVTVPYVSTDAAPTVAYTQPGAATNLRDESGNLAATFAAAAVVNTVPA